MDATCGMTWHLADQGHHYAKLGGAISRSSNPFKCACGDFPCRHMSKAVVWSSQCGFDEAMCLIRSMLADANPAFHLCLSKCQS
jgi:hypothetical protein